MLGAGLRESRKEIPLFWGGPHDVVKATLSQSPGLLQNSFIGWTKYETESEDMGKGKPHPFCQGTL